MAASAIGDREHYNQPTKQTAAKTMEAKRMQRTLDSPTEGAREGSREATEIGLKT
jgi:hypothetical protein